VELVFVLSVVLIQMFFINLLKIMEIVRTFGIYTLVYDEVLTILFMDESVLTVRTTKFERRMSILNWRELGLADFTHELPFCSIVFVEIDFWSITARTLTVIIYVAFGSTTYRFNRFVIIFVTPLEISHKIMVIPGLNIKNKWKFINLKFLILWRMGIIKSPLLERYVSTDKVK